MQIIPLISGTDLDHFAPFELVEVETLQLGTLVLHNPDKRTMLVPCHASYLAGPESADHGLPGVTLVPGRSKAEIRGAMCVQQTPAGVIAKGQHPLSILPLGLRELALRSRGKTDFRRLWHAIATFIHGAGVLGRSQDLALFFNQHQRELDQFVAEFEQIPQQVGAIILLGGELAGIERAPSQAWWAAVWGPLVRSCYGAQAIRMAHMVEAQGKDSESLRHPVKAYGLRDLHALEQAVRAADEAVEQDARRLIRDLLTEPFDATLEREADGFTLETLEGPRLIGQSVRRGEVVHYVSMVRTRERPKPPPEPGAPFSL